MRFTILGTRLLLILKTGATVPNMKPITISGKPGDDALDYQEKIAKLAIKESKK